MKKPNRIARKGDTAPTGAQSKATAASPAKSGPAASAKTSYPAAIYGTEIASFDDQRLYRDGDTYYLVTDCASVAQEGIKSDGPGQTVIELTRKRVREWLDSTVINEMIPHEFHWDFRHRNRGWTASATPDLALGELLDEDSINGLDKLGSEGVDIAAQIAGAVASWLSYAELLRASPVGGLEAVRAAPGVLTQGHYECVHAKMRAGFITADTAEYYRSLIARARQLPVKEAVAQFRALASLIEYHPAFAAEFKSLTDCHEGEWMIGKSNALTEHSNAA